MPECSHDEYVSRRMIVTHASEFWDGSATARTKIAAPERPRQWRCTQCGAAPPPALARALDEAADREEPDYD